MEKWVDGMFSPDLVYSCFWYKSSSVNKNRCKLGDMQKILAENWCAGLLKISTSHIHKSHFNLLVILSKYCFPQSIGKENWGSEVFRGKTTDQNLQVIRQIQHLSCWLSGQVWDKLLKPCANLSFSFYKKGAHPVRTAVGIIITYKVASLKWILRKFWFLSFFYCDVFL